MYVYIHLPFCKSICPYCDFPKVLYDSKFVTRYFASLEKEMVSRYEGEEVVSIYIGGGTPTCLSYEELEKLLEMTKILRKNSAIEFTIESNIESLDWKKICLLKRYGVNRVSLGVQSFQESTLQELGRGHSKDMVKDVISQLKRAGIFNISIDYIYGVHARMEEIQEDMETFLSLEIPHLSAYSLIIEEGTIFGIEKREYIQEDMEEKMYRFIEKFLTEHGFCHYEISNYSKENYASVHNLNYWNNGEYYGFGLGAVSFLKNVRIQNTKNLSKYFQGNYVEDRVEEDIDFRISNEK